MRGRPAVIPYPVILISVFLWLAAAVLMRSHVRAWRRLQQQEHLSEADRDFGRRQYRRRMQTSAMLALLAVAILIGQLYVAPLESKILGLVYWFVVLLVVGWMGLLAMADFLATKHRFDRMRQACLAEQAKLQSRIRQMKAVRGNGRAPAPDRETDDETI